MQVQVAKLILGIPFVFASVVSAFARLQAIGKVRSPPNFVTMETSAIVGKGRIGGALKDLAGKKGVLIGRGDSIPEGTGPIYVCTRNDDLADVIQRTPESRQEDLVFLQNGVLAPLLAKYGLQANTQALLYFAVAKQGEAPIDGITDLNPEGLTAVTGKWSQAFTDLLKAGGLTCHMLPSKEFAARVFEKHIFICAFNLIGTVHSCTIGECEAEHGEQTRALISELKDCAANTFQVQFEDGVEDRCCAYARSVAHYPTAIKEFKHRNGFFWELSLKARLAQSPDPTPMHTQLLKDVGAVE